MDFAHPRTTLDRMPQVDSERGDLRGGADATRCGAASILAGLVFLGPDFVSRAVRALSTRIEALEAEVTWRGGPERHARSAALSRARRDLARLPADPRSLRQRDLQALQQAIMSTASTEQSLREGGVPRPQDGLREATAGAYRDLLWGEGRPQVGGREVDVRFLPARLGERARSGDGSRGGPSPRESVPGTGMGHFVLGEISRPGRSPAIAFDPWPEGDGSAHVEGLAQDRTRPLPEEAAAWERGAGQSWLDERPRKEVRR